MPGARPLSIALPLRLLGVGVFFGVLGALAGLWVERHEGLSGPQHLLALEQNASASLLDAAVRRVEGEGRELQGLLAAGIPAPEMLRGMMEARVRHVDDLNSLQVVVLEGASGSVPPAVLYVSRKGGRLQRLNLAASGYDVRDRPWFRAAVGADAPRWSTPFFSDVAGGIDVVNLHLPARRGDELVALVSVEISVERLRQLHDRETRVPVRPLAAFVADGRGRLLAASGVAAEGVFSVVELLGGFGIARREVPNAGRLQASTGGYVLMQEPVPRLGWSIGAVYEGDDLGILGPADVALRLGAGALVGGLLAVLGALSLRVPLRPLDRAIARLEALAAGERAPPAAPEAPRSAEELRLHDVGTALASALASADARIAEQEAERETVRQELNVARQIQTAMVPDGQVFHGRRGRLVLHGELEPARAVGGDFYGFFPLGPGRCAFFLGDVSDKGIAAALFMVRVTTLIGTIARETPDLPTMLRRVSAQLMVDNDVEQFATVVFGRVDLDRGELQLASAGHEALLLRRADGTQRWCDVATGPALGFSAEGDYPVLSLPLEHGDTFVAYTDGVSEAFDPARRLFGNERLQVAVERAGHERIDRVAKAILDDVHRFADGAEQSDDITLLLMRYEDVG